MGWFPEDSNDRLRTALRREYYNTINLPIIMVGLGFPLMAYLVWLETKESYLFFLGFGLAFFAAVTLTHLLLAKRQAITVAWQYRGFYFFTVTIGLGFGLMAGMHMPLVGRETTILLVLFIAGVMMLGSRAFAHSPRIYWMLTLGCIPPETIFFFSNAAQSFNLIVGVVTIIFTMIMLFLNWQDYQNRVQYYLLNFNLKDAKEEIEKAKLQQDADYFLISLLIDPLIKSQWELGPIKVSSYIKQKKEFSFRNKRKAIGGDINTIEEIRLQGSKYIALANADAMGKSIQGAGGALVFGTMFNSMLNRVQTRISEQSVSPSTWLINTYRELEDIFASFQNTMTISAVIGLINADGNFYFTNLEHPYLILIRGGRVKFLEQEIHGQRIGYSHQRHQRIHVRNFRLKPGDVVLFGSDGKDDVVYEEAVGVGAENEAILKIIERVGDDPQKIYEEIAKNGRLTDDYSMIRIEYAE